MSSAGVKTFNIICSMGSMQCLVPWILKDVTKKMDIDHAPRPTINLFLHAAMSLACDRRHNEDGSRHGTTTTLM